MLTADATPAKIPTRSVGVIAHSFWTPPLLVPGRGLLIDFYRRLLVSPTPHYGGAGDGIRNPRHPAWELGGVHR